MSRADQILRPLMLMNRARNRPAFIRYIPALSQVFQPYVDAGKQPVTTISAKTGREYKKYSGSFNPIAAALVLVRVMELTGTSTRVDCRGTDWFEKGDEQFATELGLGLYEFRAGRKFLASVGIELIEYDTKYNPTRTLYRARFERIGAFLSPIVAGFGQLPMPVGADSYVNPREENPNVTLGKSSRDVGKIPTSRWENPHVPADYNKDHDKDHNSNSKNAMVKFIYAPEADAVAAGLDLWKEAIQTLEGAGVSLTDSPDALFRLKDRSDVREIVRLHCGLVGMKTNLHTPGGLIVKHLRDVPLDMPALTPQIVDDMLKAAKPKPRKGYRRDPVEFNDADRQRADEDARRHLEERRKEPGPSPEELHEQMRIRWEAHLANERQRAERTQQANSERRRANWLIIGQTIYDRVHNVPLHERGQASEEDAALWFELDERYRSTHQLDADAPITTADLLAFYQQTVIERSESGSESGSESQ